MSEQVTNQEHNQEYDPNQAQYDLSGSHNAAPQHDNGWDMQSQIYGHYPNTYVPFYYKSPEYPVQNMPNQGRFHGQGVAPVFAHAQSTSYLSNQTPMGTSPDLTSPLNHYIQSGTEPYNPFTAEAAYNAAAAAAGYNADAAGQYQASAPNPPAATYDPAATNQFQAPEEDVPFNEASLRAILSQLSASSNPAPIHPTADWLDIVDLRRKFNAQIVMFRLRNDFRLPEVRDAIEAAIAEFEAGYQALEKQLAEKIFPHLARGV